MTKQEYIALLDYLMELTNDFDKQVDYFGDILYQLHRDPSSGSQGDK